MSATNHIEDKLTNLTYYKSSTSWIDLDYPGNENRFGDQGS